MHLIEPGYILQSQALEYHTECVILSLWQEPEHPGEGVGGGGVGGVAEIPDLGERRTESLGKDGVPGVGGRGEGAATWPAVSPKYGHIRN